MTDDNMAQITGDENVTTENAEITKQMMNDAEKVRKEVVGPTRKELEELVVGCQFMVVPFTTSTLCMLFLRNGYRVVGHSAAVRAEDYTELRGQRGAYRDAFDQLMDLEVYHRMSVAAESAARPAPASEPGLEERARNFYASTLQAHEAPPASETGLEEKVRKEAMALWKKIHKLWSFMEGTPSPVSGKRYSELSPRARMRVQRQARQMLRNFYASTLKAHEAFWE